MSGRAIAAPPRFYGMVTSYGWNEDGDCGAWLGKDLNEFLMGSLNAKVVMFMPKYVRASEMESVLEKEFTTFSDS